MDIKTPLKKFQKKFIGTKEKPILPLGVCLILFILTIFFTVFTDYGKAASLISLGIFTGLTGLNGFWLIKKEKDNEK